MSQTHPAVVDAVLMDAHGSCPEGTPCGPPEQTPPTVWMSSHFESHGDDETVMMDTRRDTARTRPPTPETTATPPDNASVARQRTASGGGSPGLDSPDPSRVPEDRQRPSQGPRSGASGPHPDPVACPSAGPGPDAEGESPDASLSPRRRKWARAKQGAKKALDRLDHNLDKLKVRPRDGGDAASDRVRDP